MLLKAITAFSENVLRNKISWSKNKGGRESSAPTKQKGNNERKIFLKSREKSERINKHIHIIIIVIFAVLNHEEKIKEEIKELVTFSFSLIYLFFVSFFIYDFFLNALDKRFYNIEWLESNYYFMYHFVLIVSHFIV
ncbi:hypothetical protein ACKWTF_002160 [Chironomus riparius]